MLQLLLALTLLCQSDDEKAKKRVMDEVKSRLDKSRAALMEKISKLIDDELGIKHAATSNKKLADLEKRIRKIEDEQNALRIELRELKWWEADARLIEEAAKEELNQQEYVELFREALDDLTNKEYERSIKAFKRIFYMLIDNENERVVRLASGSAYNVACGYALWGKKDEALDWLEISYRHGIGESGDQCHEDFIAHTENDSDLDSLRNEPRYKELIRRAKESKK